MSKSRRKLVEADAAETQDRAKRAKGDAAAVKKATKQLEVTEKYSSQEFWDKRYEDGDVKHIWYFDFERLKPLLSEYVKSEASVLEIGCGDAPVLDGMAADGHKGNLLAVDFSGTVIDDLNTGGTSRNVKYSQMDARKLQIEDESFDVVMDKGTIDAMLCDEEERWDNVYKIMIEACRVLKSDGVIILISHMAVGSSELHEALQNAILPALHDKSSVQWQVVAHVSETEEEDEEEDEDASEGGDSHEGSGESGPVVYIIQSSKRRFTRSLLANKSDLEVPMKVKYYGS